ncbi:hypothetical protein [Microbacterium sp.]|uniref:hypothetical protein n=1 Tax=Microbacterium sp. TaxID=51671 RepID=UPI0039E57573
MTKIEIHDGDNLIAEWERLTALIAKTEFPRLKVMEVVERGETFTTLECPRCGEVVRGGDLAAVDQSVRQNYAHDMDVDDEDVRFDNGDIDFGATLYYLHKDDHAVSLPEGWTESWT